MLLFIGSRGTVSETPSTETSESTVQPFTAPVTFTHVRTVIPEFSPEQVLSSPGRLRVDRKGNFIWAEYDPPIHVFDSAGYHITTFGPAGNGPGEVGASVDFGFDGNGDIYVFDNPNKKISVFDTNYEFSRSYRIDTDNLSRIAIDREGHLYRLRSAWYNGDFPAVSKHDPNGDIVAQWGVIAPKDRIQNNIFGGGIEVGDALYYGYISDHKIWKTDLEGNLLTVFDAQPEFYLASDGRALKKGAPSDAPGGFNTMMQYWRTRSRVLGLSLVKERQLLFQAIVTCRDNSCKVTLEVWHTDGFKIASGVKSPRNRVPEYADANFIYFVGFGSEESNRPIEIYEYSLGTQIPTITRES